jgi:putative hydrolase of the HAD superfamily
MAAGMATEVTRLSAVLVDGMGTLLRLIPPVPALARALAVDETRAERGFRAEVTYYLEHQLEAFDTARLWDLRRRCAAVLADAASVGRDGALEALMSSLRFEAFPDAAPALTQLRARGLKVVVVSNWDCSLPDVLDGIGLLGLVDAVVSSAVVGAAKPDARIFEAALAAAGCRAIEAVHVGDSVENDVEGARRVGIRPLLLARDGGGDVSSLQEMVSLLS